MSHKVAKSLFMTIPALIATVTVSGAPAQAATGGGCNHRADTTPCISYAHQGVWSDFYPIRPPDAGSRLADLMIYVNGRNVRTVRYTLTRTGRHGPISWNVATIPPSRGSAYTKVRIYDTLGRFHYEVNSPTVYYP